MKLFSLALAALISAFSSLSFAAIVDYDTYTVDTSTELAFLDIDETGNHDLAYYEAGVSAYGFNWRLATLSEIDSLFSGIVGYTVDHSSVSTVDFQAGGAKAILDLLASPTIDNTRDLGGTSSRGWFEYDGRYDGMIIHYDCCNDTHLSNLGDTTSTFAYLVTDFAVQNSSNEVPAPATLGLIALGLLAMRRLRNA